MSADSRCGSIRGEKDTVETTYFGTPSGSAWQMSRAASVPIVPPRMTTPSKRPSACSRAANLLAPRAMICIAVFSSPLSIAAWIELPPASATSCLLKSVGVAGSPRTEMSMLSAPPPMARMRPTM